METANMQEPKDLDSQAEYETSQAITLSDRVQTLSVLTVNDYTYADGILKEIKARIKKLDELEDSMKKPLNLARQRIIDFFRPAKQKLEYVKTIVNQEMVKWAEDQERIRREEEKKLQEAARKRAEEEVIRQALEAELAGEKEEAEKIIEEPVYVPPVRIVSNVPKSKESHIRETWSAEVVDIQALIQAVANGLAPINALSANMLFLNEQARSYKQALALRMPGVRAVSKKTQV